MADSTPCGQHGLGYRWCPFPTVTATQRLGGHITSAIVGVLVGTTGIDPLWGGALAGALALGVMKLMRMSHSPAAATAMIAVVPAIPRWEFVVLTGSAAAILVVVGLVGNRINRAKYPHYWW